MKSLSFRALTAALAAVALLLVASGDAAAQSTSVLGDDGVLYSLQTVSYGELDPDGHLAAEDNEVLALMVNRGEQGVERLLVPNTEGEEAEVNPALILEESTGNLYLLWESWYGRGLHSRIHLLGYGESGWTDIVEISGSPFVLKSSPRVMLTRDENSLLDGEGNQEHHERTILHLVWVENAATDEERIIYAPQLLLDGEFVVSGQRVVLNDLVPESEAVGGAYALDAPILNLQAGENPQSVVVVFSDRRSQRLVSLDMRVLPGELSFLADHVHTVIAARPASATASAESLAAVAELAADSVAEIGSSLQPLLRRELAAQVRSFITDQQLGVSPQVLAEASRDHLLEAGADLTESGIQHITGRRRPHWIDLGYQPPGKPSGENVRSVRSYQVVSQVATEAPAPEAILQQGVDLMVSKDGEDLVLVWQQGESELFYQESDAGSETGWSRTNRLRLSDDFGPRAARILLQNRIDKR